MLLESSEAPVQRGEEEAASREGEILSWKTWVHVPCVRPAAFHDDTERPAAFRLEMSNAARSLGLELSKSLS